MKAAISNIAWGACEDALVLSKLPSLGIQGLEIAPTRIFETAPYEKLSEAKAFAKELLDRQGLPVCSMQSIWYKRSEAVFGKPDEQKALADYTRQAILFAGAVSCPNLVLGSPRNRIVPPGRSGEEAIPFFRELGDFAASHGAVLALEAVPAAYGTNFLNTTGDLFQYVRAVNSPGIRMNLDFGTMLANGEDVSAAGRYLPLVSHVHISEPALAAVEKRKEHAVFLQALREGGYDRFVSIEMGNQKNPEKVFETVSYLVSLLA